jgi:integrase
MANEYNKHIQKMRKLLRTTPTGHRRKPSLYWYCKTPNGWRYIPAPDAERSEVVTTYPGGRMMLRERLGSGQRVYTQVKGDASTTLQAARRRAATHNSAMPMLMGSSTLKGQIKEFITRYENKSKREAAKKASEALNDFQLACPDVRSAKHITLDHVLRFHGWLAEKGNVPRTVFNKHKLLHVFLKFAKVDVDEVIPANSKPRYEQPPITIYEPEDIEKLLAHADSYMALVISMAYGLGLRERELMHVEFSDILSTRVLVVQSKPRFMFTTKTHEHRKIAIHSDLYERLMAWQRQYPNRRLILGVGKGFETPNTGLLGRLKRLAQRAGVNDATLHRFRRTFISVLLRSGMPIRDVQAQAGHKSMAATDRYAQALGAEKLVSHHDAVFRVATALPV